MHAAGHLKCLRRSLLAKATRDSADNSATGMTQASPSEGSNWRNGQAATAAPAEDVEWVYIHESSYSAHLWVSLPVLLVSRPHIDQEVEKP